MSQLDKPLPLDLRDVQIIPLENADATVLAAALQRLIEARVSQRSALGQREAETLRALIIGDPRTNSLLFSGSKDTFDLVQSLARELDKAPSALSGQIRLVPLTHADARNLSATLTTLFTQRNQASRLPDVQRLRPIIVPDPRSNGLLVAAGMEDNQVLDSLVQKLDRQLDDPSMVVARAHAGGLPVLPKLRLFRVEEVPAGA